MPSDTPSIQKLRWQCRRGMLELDFVLRRFLDTHYATIGPDQQTLFVRMLDCEDQLLLDWVMGNVVPSDPELRRLVEMMRSG